MADTAGPGPDPSWGVRAYTEADHPAQARVMRRLIADARGRGEKVAVLWSSEGGIYDRFGFGQAVFEQSVGIDRRDARLRPDLPRDPGSGVQLREARHTLLEMLGLYRRLSRSRVGHLVRRERWFQGIIGPVEEGRNAPQPAPPPCRREETGARTPGGGHRHHYDHTRPLDGARHRPRRIHAGHRGGADVAAVPAAS